MADTLRTHIELHNDLLEIAKMAVQQVKENQIPEDHLLPGEVPSAATQKA
jgi:hypothetical protein